jgi:hypothetical protein
VKEGVLDLGIQPEIGDLRHCVTCGVEMPPGVFFGPSPGNWRVHNEHIFEPKRTILHYYTCPECAEKEKR